MKGGQDAYLEQNAAGIKGRLKCIIMDYRERIKEKMLTIADRDGSKPLCMCNITGLCKTFPLADGTDLLWVLQYRLLQ